MSDFSVNYSGLTQRAQKFIKEKIDENQDGKLSAGERNTLAQVLSSTLPDEYSGIRDELEQLGRNYDVEAARSELFDDEADSVQIRGMADKDMNKIDSEQDFQTMKAIAEGKIPATPQQRAYAKALLEFSPYARERMLKEENNDLRAKNEALLQENSELKAKIDSFEQHANIAEDGKSMASAAMNELDGCKDLPTDILFKLKDECNKIFGAQSSIIDLCNKQSDIVEKFKNGTLTEKTLNSSLDMVDSQIQDFKKQVDKAKERGRQAINEVENETPENNTTGATAVGAAEAQVTGNSAGHVGIAGAQAVCSLFGIE